MAAEDTAPANIARSVTGNPVFLLTALGLILYGILRLANSIFYERLAVKPEEVGLGYAETLSQSAVGVLAILALGFVVFGVLVFFVGVLVPATFRREDAPKPPSRLDKVLLAVVVLTVIGSLVAHLVWGTDVFGPVAKVVLGSVAIVGWLQVTWADVRMRDPRRLGRPAFVALAIAVVSTVALVLVGAWDDGRGVRGGQVRHPTFLGLPFGSWGADAAWVDWVGRDPPSGFARGRRCLLYLGQANGTAVFYDAGASTTIRVPATTVAVTIRDSRHNAQQACR